MTEIHQPHSHDQVRDSAPDNAADSNPTRQEFDKWGVEVLLHEVYQQHRREIAAAVREEFADTLSDAEFEAKVNERSMLVYVDASGKQTAPPQPRFPELGPHRIPKDSTQLAGLHYLRRGNDLSAGEIADAHGNREGIAIRTVLLPDRLEGMKDDPRVARLRTPGQMLRMAEEAEQEGGVVAREIRIQLNQKFTLHENVDLVRRFAKERIYDNGNAAEIIVFDKLVDAQHPYQAVVLETDRKATLRGFGIKTHNAERGRQTYDPTHAVPLEYEWIKSKLNLVQELALQGIYKREGGQRKDFHDWARKNYSHVLYFPPMVDQGRHTEPAELAKGRITGLEKGEKYPLPVAQPAARKSVAATVEQAYIDQVRKNSVAAFRQASANQGAGFAHFRGQTLAGTDAKAGGAEKNAASSKGKDPMDSAL